MDVKEIIEAEKNSFGKKLMYGFNHDIMMVIKMKSIIDEGKLGKVIWMRGDMEKV